MVACAGGCTMMPARSGHLTRANRGVLQTYQLRNCWPNGQAGAMRHHTWSTAAASWLASPRTALKADICALSFLFAVLVSVLKGPGKCDGLAYGDGGGVTLGLLQAYARRWRMPSRLPLCTAACEPD